MRRRGAFVCLCVACGSAAATPAQVTIATLPTPPASASATAPKATDPASLVHEALLRWLDLLDRNEDERLIRDVLSPEDIEKIDAEQGGMEAMLREFRADKRETIVRVFRAASQAKPRVAQDGDHVLVDFGRIEGDKLMFIVEGLHVHLQGH